jgi:ATP/ADP translocase
VAVTDIGGVLFSVPISLVIKRVGWRGGFIIGGIVGMVSSLLLFAGTWFKR